ncbi:metalloprotease TIKI homolog isoform X1 [Montipora capricornis]|uniref:metalloprotease TIKI homolog isoform X1 n=1 Tax=Montipora capricornis TaxID=246305 RepID=UPI0035F106F5
MASTHSNLLWVLLLILSESTLKGQNVFPDRSVTSKRCSDYAHQENLNSFLWLVRRNPPAYFFGTIHVPYTRVWDYIPTNSKTAFRTSQYVYFELDLTQKSTITALWKCQMLPNGGLLKDVIPRSLYRRVLRHLRYIKRKMPVWLKDSDDNFRQGMGPYANKIFQLLTKDWKQKRPIWVMLLVNSLTESDIKSRGIPVLDQYLALEASRNQQVTGAVEEVVEQCRPLNSLNDSQVIFALNQTLNFQEKLRDGKATLAYTTDDLIDHYNCGDLNTVLSFSTQTARLSTMNSNSSSLELEIQRTHEIDAYFRTELIVKRNERMAKRVIELLNKHPERDFFFAFGAGHFIGNHSIIDIMRREGFAVDHIRPNDQLPRVKTVPDIVACPKTRRNKHRCRKCRRRQRRRCWDKRKKEPDFSRVKLVLKMTNTPTEKSDNSSAHKEEYTIKNELPVLQSSAAVKIDKRQVKFALTLLCLLLCCLARNVM